MKQTEQGAAAQVIELSELPEVPAGALVQAHLGLVQNVRATLTVVAGSTELSIGELLALKAEQVLQLDRLVEDPVELMLDGKVVARGQLVAVEDNFGVRIVDVPRGGQA
jgi:flagellar motor switch protein FliN/FliY